MTDSPVQYIFCLSCGWENSQTAAICEHCGDPMEITDQDRLTGVAYVLNELDDLLRTGVIQPLLHRRLRAYYLREVRALTGLAALPAVDTPREGVPPAVLMEQPAASLAGNSLPAPDPDADRPPPLGGPEPPGWQHLLRGRRLLHLQRQGRQDRQAGSAAASAGGDPNLAGIAGQGPRDHEAG